MAPGLVCLKREVAAFKLRGSSACLKERWPSGRRRTPGTRVGGQPSRGFKSHPLRHSPLVSKALLAIFHLQYTNMYTRLTQFPLGLGVRRYHSRPSSISARQCAGLINPYQVVVGLW